MELVGAVTGFEATLDLNGPAPLRIVCVVHVAGAQRRGRVAFVVARIGGDELCVAGESHPHVDLGGRDSDDRLVGLGDQAVQNAFARLLDALAPDPGDRTLGPRAVRRLGPPAGLAGATVRSPGFTPPSSQSATRPDPPPLAPAPPSVLRRVCKLMSSASGRSSSLR